MRPLTIAAISTLAIALSSCIHSDYLGKNYEPTSQVDLFFDAADVQADYEVMGEVTLESASDLDFAVSSEDLQEKMIELAREKGADGVILGPLEKKTTGESTSSTAVSNRTTESTTEIKESKTVKGKLIKYRKNLPGGAPVAD
jgi:hypothetical protein